MSTNEINGMDRREFLEMGAGLLIGFAMPQFTGVRIEDAPYPTLYGPFPAMQMRRPMENHSPTSILAR